MDTEFDAVPELVPDWNRHPRLASEMHCTIAHRLTSHTHPTRSPAKPADVVDSTCLTHPPFLASRASYGEADRGRCHFSAAKLLLLAVRRTRAACSKTSSGHLDHLEWLPSCFSTTDLRPEPTAQLHLLPRLSAVRVV